MTEPTILSQFPSIPGVLLPPKIKFGGKETEPHPFEGSFLVNFILGSYLLGDRYNQKVCVVALDSLKLVNKVVSC